MSKKEKVGERQRKYNKNSIKYAKNMHKIYKKQ